MHVALIGTRGIPARYGGFETAIEEIAPRLVAAGIGVTVYCRPDPEDSEGGRNYRGCERVVLPAIKAKTLETLSHTGLSVGRLVTRRKPDAVIMFNSANSVYLPAIRARNIPVATHVDGLEWRRAKWSGAGRAFYRTAEELAVRWSDALIADAVGIADYYREKFDVPTELISYGAPILSGNRTEKLETIGLAPGSYHLVVARFEPENHVAEIVEGFAASRARLRLVVVGGAPYASAYTSRVNDLALRDPRIHLLGSVWDQELLDQLYQNSATYVHGHSVGGTNPSLLRAMGAAAPVIAFDVDFNREVIGPQARTFATPAELASRLEQAEAAPEATRAYGRAGQEHVAANYRWRDVADKYADLIQRLAAGESIQGSGRSRLSDAAAQVMAQEQG